VPRPTRRTLRCQSGYAYLPAYLKGCSYHRVEPVYPSIAQRARIEGAVELKAIISKEGTIEGLQRITGHPMLVAAAMDAVKQWRYRPYMLNGEPLKVETDVLVNFHIH
jgi:periplasmic protein TonB